MEEGVKNKITKKTTTTTATVPSAAVYETHVTHVATGNLLLKEK